MTLKQQRIIALVTLLVTALWVLPRCTVPPNPTSNIDIDYLIVKMTEARDIHQKWSDWYETTEVWLEDHPDAEPPIEFELMGDADYHDEWILVYEDVLIVLAHSKGDVE